MSRSTKALEDIGGEFIDQYEDEMFWEEPVDRLVDRDCLRKYGPEQLKKISLEERFRARDEFEEVYSDEFCKNGLENIVIAQSTPSRTRT